MFSLQTFDFMRAIDVALGLLAAAAALWAMTFHPGLLPEML